MVLIRYGSVALGASEDFEATLQDCSDVSNAENLTSAKDLYGNYGNPCEEYSVLLDGNCLPIPQESSDEIDTSGINIGVWSEAVADETGALATAPTIVLESAAEYKLHGLTLVFDAINDIYPTSVTVAWYKGAEKLSEESYSCAASELSIQHYEETCDKIVIMLNALNTPLVRAKLRGVIYGQNIVIEGRDINSVQVTQEVCPLSTTLPISTAEMTFLNTAGADYDFAERQDLVIYNDNKMIGKYFIEEATRLTKKQWRVMAYDYIGLLDSVDFVGNLYYGKTAKVVADEIFSAAGVKYTMSDELAEKQVTGFIPYTTCRKALQQLLFAIGGFARTAYSETVDLLPVSTTIRESIPMAGRILLGTQSVKTETDVSEIELVSHKYVNDFPNMKTLYTVEEDVENAKIMFSDPVEPASLYLSKDDEQVDGGIIEKGVNYAILTAPAGSVLKGIIYLHETSSKTVTNTKGHIWKSNKKTISDATMVGQNNLDEALARCYDYLTRTKTVSSKVVEADPVLMVGEQYEIETESWGKLTGTNVQQSFALYGNKVAKKIKIK